MVRLNENWAVLVSVCLQGVKIEEKSRLIKSQKRIKCEAGFQNQVDPQQHLSEMVKAKMEKNYKYPLGADSFRMIDFLE